MNKNLRLPLFGLLGVAIVGLGAAIVFSGGKDDKATETPPADTPSETLPPESSYRGRTACESSLIALRRMLPAHNSYFVRFQPMY